jgi:CBS domain-containing protein
MNAPALNRSGLDQTIVSEWMTTGVITCSPETTLSDVAEIMATRRVHCIVVRGYGRAEAPLWGIVSDLDLVAAACVRDLDDQTARGSAATPALVVGPSETMERAAQVMTEHAAAHLVVVEEGRPVGVLSTLDVAAACTRRRAE